MYKTHLIAKINHYVGSLADICIRISMTAT